MLGPNGSGKSSLLRIMAGEDHDYQGEEWIARGAELEELARRFGGVAGSPLISRAVRTQPPVLVYEVSATVQPELVSRYELYMRDTHIPDVLASGCFVGASFVKAAGNRYRIMYQVADEATLQRYLDDHAPALRADFIRHFPAGVELAREVWQVVDRGVGPA